jgi:hypothetical protein
VLERARDVLRRVDMRPARLADVLELLGRVWLSGRYTDKDAWDVGGLGLAPGSGSAARGGCRAAAERCFTHCVALREIAARRGGALERAALEAAERNLAACKEWEGTQAMEQ